MTVVLDSWALLRFLEDEDEAADVVATLLESERPVVSWINLGEVFYVLRRRAGEGAAAATVRDLRDVIVAELPDEQRVMAAGRIKSDFPLAYADAFAAATAEAHGAQLWTGDPELLVEDAPWVWRDLELTRRIASLTGELRGGGWRRAGAGSSRQDATATRLRRPRSRRPVGS